MGKRKNDLIVSFDEESRKDFILGFQKRKKQRRELALKKLVQRQAELRHQDRIRYRPEPPEPEALALSEGEAEAAVDAEEGVLETAQERVTTVVERVRSRSSSPVATRPKHSLEQSDDLVRVSRQLQLLKDKLSGKKQPRKKKGKAKGKGRKGRKRR